MKRLVLTVTVILILVALAAAGCGGKEPAGPAGGQEVVSSCVACHSDKDLLKQTASVPEVVASEATTGEG